MKKITLFFFLTILLLVGAGIGLGEELKPQTQCPVMGGAVDKDVYLDYQGQRVYFCCESCKGEFKKNL